MQTTAGTAKRKRDQAQGHARHRDPHRARARGAANVLPVHDREQLGALLASQRPRLLAIARRVVRDHQAAEDIVQNALENAVRFGRGFDGRARVSTWLYRIVTNEALMWLRSERRRRLRFVGPELEGLHEPVDAGPDALRSACVRERLEQVRVGLTALPHRDREVLLRYATQDGGYREGARRAGVHPSALKTRVFRARRRLLALLPEQR